MSSHYCLEVSPQCPVEATLYGYRPSFAGNIVLAAVFAACTLGQLVLGLRYKLRAFTFAASVGCAGEAVGYGGRIIMHSNPWSAGGFKTQIVCLVLSPSFLAAGIYLTIKSLVTYFGPEYSRLKPRLYTIIFISCDVFSMVIQAVGGGVASANDPSIVGIGSKIIVAGIAFQVATMAVCLLLAAEFGYKIHKNQHTFHQSGTAMPAKFRFYAICIAVAFLCIFVRCIYRVPEMAGGWGNPLMQNEKEFMILDGALIAIACILMTIAHPGIFFPAISSRHAKLAQKTDSLPAANEHATSLEMENESKVV